MRASPVDDVVPPPAKLCLWLPVVAEGPGKPFVDVGETTFSTGLLRMYTAEPFPPPPPLPSFDRPLSDTEDKVFGECCGEKRETGRT